jgi:hypothetical protein
MRLIKDVSGLLFAAAVFTLVGCAPPVDGGAPARGARYWDMNTIRSPPPPAAEPADPDPAPPVAPVTRDARGADPAPRLDARAADPPRTGDASASAPAPAPAPGPPGQGCSLTFTVTTVSFNGDYAPRNVGAIWISDAGGGFVKSLNVWGNKRRRHLQTWNDASNGNTVDAVTAATQSNHGTRTGTWNCTGVDRKVVADGMYRVNVNFTESNSGERVMTPLPFTKGAAPIDVRGTDQTNFKNIHLGSAP